MDASNTSEIIHVITSILLPVVLFVVLPLVAYTMKIRKEDFDKVQVALQRHLEWHISHPYGHYDNEDEDEDEGRCT